MYLNIAFDILHPTFSCVELEEPIKASIDLELSLVALKNIRIKVNIFSKIFTWYKFFSFRVLHLVLWRNRRINYQIEKFFRNCHQFKIRVTFTSESSACPLWNIHFNKWSVTLLTDHLLESQSKIHQIVYCHHYQNKPAIENYSRLPSEQNFIFFSLCK